MKETKDNPDVVRRRPASPTDFDINIGLHNLKMSEQTDQLRVWKAPLWENIVCFVFLLIVIISGYITVTSDPDLFGSTESAWDTSIQWVVGGVFFLSLWFLSARCLHRARLELHYDEGCLLFYRRLILPTAFYRLGLRDIASVRKCTAAERGSGDESIGWEFKIIAAELKTGELVSIAFDSSPSILSDIRKALAEQQ
jgi:hypothetical protein